MDLLSLKNQLKREFLAHNIDVCDAEFIIAEVLSIPRTQIALVDEISAAKQKAIMRAAKLRLNGMPVDQIFGVAYFYGLKFKVTKSVLTPRQDSEILVDEAIKIIRTNKLGTMLDLCTGSGALAVAIAKNTGINATASDKSLRALKIAKFNAEQNGVDINFVHSDMFGAIHGKFDLIVSNPPYIPSGYIKSLDVEVKNYDPILALDGGADGLKFYRIIAKNVGKYLNKNGYLLLEIGYNQAEDVKKIFTDLKFVACLKDLGGNNRVLVFKN